MGGVLGRMVQQTSEQQLDEVARRHDEDTAYLLVDWTVTHSRRHPFSTSRRDQFWDARLLSPCCENI